MVRSSTMTRVGVILLTTIGAGVLASPAQAASTGVVWVSKTTQVKYTAATGRANTVVITRSGRTVTIDDKVKIKAGKGCKAVKGDKTKVRCKLKKNPTRIVVSAGNKNDTVLNKTSIRSTIDGGTGNDVLVGGGVNDMLYGQAGNDRIYGGNGNDYAVGGTGNDRMYGQGGNDYLLGAENDDTLYGGEGTDSLGGNAGNDKLYGERHNDTIDGGAGNDLVDGGSGNDTLDGDKPWTPGVIGTDVILGGPGRDYVSYNRARATVDLDGEKGDDGAPGEGDTVGADVEDLSGTGAGAYVLTGNNAGNLIRGGSGDNVIRGGGGDDEIHGNGGANRLFGDAGDDKIHGSDFAEDAADTLDGGTNSPAIGDLCWLGGTDTATGCERLA